MRPSGRPKLRLSTRALASMIARGLSLRPGPRGATKATLRAHNKGIRDAHLDRLGRARGGRVLRLPHVPGQGHPGSGPAGRAAGDAAGRAGRDAGSGRGQAGGRRSDRRPPVPRSRRRATRRTRPPPWSSAASTSAPSSRACWTRSAPPWAASPTRPRPMRRWPSLDELKGKVEGMTAQVDQLPAEGKKMLAGLVSTALPSLKELVAKVGGDLGCGIDQAGARRHAGQARDLGQGPGLTCQSLNRPAAGRRTRSRTAGRARPAPPDRACRRRWRRPARRRTPRPPGPGSG